MKSLSVRKGLLISKVEVPPSKSYANRALILAALIEKSFSIKNLPSATDVTILLDCLKRIGLTCAENNSEISITNSFPACEKGDLILNVGEGGTTARFLATMLLLGKSEYKLILGERLKERPWEEFLELAISLKAKARLDGNTLTIQGPVELPSVIQIDASKTTQFATAFELLSIVKNFKVKPTGMESSQSYWKMTESLVDHFKHNDSFSVPLDWSSASYPMAFAALKQKIFFPDLFPDEHQADSKLLDVLKKLGCVDISEDGITVQPGIKNMSFNIDVSDCLDLVPTLAYLFSNIEGHHIISGFQNLVHKESNRLKEVIKLIENFGRKVVLKSDALEISGSNELITKSPDLVFPNDHRMVMAGTLFLLHHNGGSVSPVDAVTKSYPQFFSLIKA